MLRKTPTASLRLLWELCQGLNSRPELQRQEGGIFSLLCNWGSEMKGKTMSQKFLQGQQHLRGWKKQGAEMVGAESGHLPSHTWDLQEAQEAKGR